LYKIKLPFISLQNFLAILGNDDAVRDQKSTYNFRYRFPFFPNHHYLWPTDPGKVQTLHFDSAMLLLQIKKKISIFCNGTQKKMTTFPAQTFLGYECSIVESKADHIRVGG
jgi:hypothetical protein